MRIRNKNRRGITLLFVISMIVLFLLMGTTFLIVSNDYFRAAKKRALTKINSKDTNALVHRSFYKIVRGSDLTDVDSPMRGIDLMSDQYGYGFKVSVQTAAPVDATRLQLIQLQMHTVSGIDNGHQILGFRDLLEDAKEIVAGNPAPDDLVGGDAQAGGQFDYSDAAKNYMPELDAPGYFAGQVLTFISGPAKGVSARIVDYTVTIDTSAATPRAIRSFVIVPERLPNGASTPFDNINITVDGVNTTGIASLGDVRDGGGNLVNTPSQVIINGRPFSGLGSGVNTTNFSIDQNNALRPNHARFNLASGAAWNDLFFTTYATIRNSVNEPYDAFDHDNVFLAQNLTNNGPSASYNPVQLAPANFAGNGGIEQNRYSFRPVFQWETGSPGTPAVNNTANQFFPNVMDYQATSPPAGWNAEPHDLQSRPLDVDNDNDGVLDSVWIDMGHEVVTTKDGRLVKPLVAAMVVDLDSRLNVNAHGTFADAQARATSVAGGFMTPSNLLGPNSTTPAVSINMPRGLGWGPAEISLAPLLADYRPLLVGYTSTTPLPTILPFDAVPILPGRYGYDRFPGNSYFDFAAQFRFSDHPSFGTVGGSFKSRPMDIQGRFATGFPAAYETHTILDAMGNPVNVDVPYGMPIADIATSTWPPVGPYSNSDPMNPYPGFGTEVYNSPYEISLYQEGRRGDDLLFTPDELEAMLRTFDIDSQLLSSRLLDFNVSTNRRNLITTDSFEVPALPPTLFRARVGGTTQTVNQSIPERLYEILKANNPALTHNEIFLQMRGGTATPANVVHSLLSHEVMRGLPMNVNRPFGDGADNDGDGITDEHWNSAAAEENEAVSETYPLTAIGLDHNNDGASDFQDRFARQIFARHLFVLTWLTASPAIETAAPYNPQIPDMNNDGNNDDDDIAFLAQWCVNVVDFRDADSICTPFKYDLNPWDGWDASPEVQAGDAAYITPPPGPGVRTAVVWGLERPELLITEALATHERRYTDSDSNGAWESEYVPKASVFVELYNPWATNGNTESAPAEFYTGGGIDLGRHTNALSGGAVEDPVWRLAFTEQRDDAATDPNSRRVYFREPSTNVETSDTGNYYHPTSTFQNIPPNGYAVIGSSGVQTASGDFRTTFGRRSDADELSDLVLDDTRSITLIPNVGVDVVDGTDGANMITESRQCVVVPVDVTGRNADQLNLSLGITDPDRGYDPTGTLVDIIDPDGNGDPSDGDGFKYKTPLAGPADPRGSEAQRDGITHGARYVHLQRLANPEVPFDADLNPYVTVDVAPVDIFSFNGLATTNNDVTDTSGAFDFDSQERGETQNGTLGAWDAGFDGVGVAENDRVLWPEEDLRAGMTDVAPINTDLHFLSQEFNESFGAMNETYRGIDASVSIKPFPWLTWNNRPFVSQYELVNVPMFRAREVLNNYTASNSDHLVQSYDSTFKRVFEFLEVPPRFVASEVGFQPTAFNGESPSVASAAVFNAPFNYTSRYRYPGKININTIPDDAGASDPKTIWNVGLMSNWNIPYSRLSDVRGDQTRNNAPSYPTGHSAIGTVDSIDPIRPDGVAMFDLPRAEPDPATLSSGDSDGSLLRSGAVDNLFQPNGDPYNDPDRNNAFYSAPITRLGNLSTNRSSVFAIWITVGYFEVDNQGRLGAEVGSDTGEVTRNRGFYIFDRSIPMGFEPGKNHNVERGILVQSIIE